MGITKNRLREIIIEEHQKLNEKNISDEEFVADQLANTWEYMSPQEMFKELAKKVKVDKTQLKKLVNDYYKNDKRRNADVTGRDTLNWVEEYI